LAASTEVFGAMSPSTDVAIFFASFDDRTGLATANYWAITQSLLRGLARARGRHTEHGAESGGRIVAPIITGWLKSVTGSYMAPMQTIWVS